MSLIKHYSILEDELKSKPFEEGALYVTSDTNRIFADLVGGGSHTLISASPIILSTEEERENLLAPIHNTIYFVSSTSKLYVNNNGNWLVASYSHPSYTSHQSGLYKISVDGTGHINGATAVSKEDITKLGIPGQDTTYDVATDSKNGLMSSSMVTKLEGIDPGANKTIVDESLSSTSTNPVQNKVINNALANKQPMGDYALKSELSALVGDTPVSDQISIALEDVVSIDIDLDGSNEGEANPLNADTLGGKYESELSVAKALNADTLGGYINADDVNGKLSMELIWENASPNSEFATQTVYINSIESTHALIEFRVSANNANFVMCVIAKVGKQTELIRITPTEANSKFIIMTRYATVNSDKIVFGDAWSGTAVNTPSVNNAYCVPTKIYIIKGVSA